MALFKKSRKINYEIVNLDRLKKIVFPKSKNILAKDILMIVLDIVSPILIAFYTAFLQLRIPEDDSLLESVIRLGKINLLLVTTILLIVLSIWLTIKSYKKKKKTTEDESMKQIESILKILSDMLKITTQSDIIRCNVFIYDEEIDKFGSLCNYNHNSNSKKLYSKDDLVCFKAYENSKIIIKNLTKQEKRKSSFASIESIYVAPIFVKSKKIGVIVFDSNKTIEACNMQGPKGEELLQNISDFIKDYFE